ncbi:MAG: hypothetical protein HY290_02435 [Planctomycetia bacterium]|nr:hypothetical protein [Planctomycetia bacterium]
MVRFLLIASFFGGVDQAADGKSDGKPADEIVGRLESPEGQPIVDFKVEAFRQTGRAEGEFVTGDDGAFRVPAAWFRDPLFAGEEFVCIARDSAGGLGWFQIQSSSARARNGAENPRPTPFRLALLPTERTITGRIVDPDQKPLAGVRIQVQRLRHPLNGDLYLYGFGMKDELPLPSAATDDKGRFRLKLPSGADATLHALHPAWVVRHFGPAGDDDLGEMAMQPAGRIAGKVVLAGSGRPVAGIVVSATRFNAVRGRSFRRNPRGEDPDANLGMDGYCVTDAEGRYEIGGLKTDLHEMQVNAGPNHRDLLGPHLRDIDVQTGKTVTVDMTVQKGRRVAGQLVEAGSGKPIPGRRVYANVFGDRERQRSLISSPYPITNERGEFECFVLPGFARFKVEAYREEPLKQIPESTSEFEIGEQGPIPRVVLKLRGPTPAEVRRLRPNPTLQFSTRPNAIGGFAFDHEGKLLVTAGWFDTDAALQEWSNGTVRGDLRIWDAKTSAEIARIEGEFGGLFGAAISPDGTALATAGRVLNSPDAGELRIWDLKTRELRGVLQGHTKWVLAVAYSPKGKYLVSGSFDKTARIWDAATGNELVSLPQSSTPNYLRFSRDGRTLLVGCRGGTIKLYDGETWKERLSLEVKGARLFDVDLSSDGRYFAAAGAIYEADGQSIKSSTPGLIRIWDATTGKELRSWNVEGHSSGIAFSPNGKHLADARHTSSVWDVETGEELAAIFRNMSSSGDQVRFSADGKSLAIAGHQGLQFWDISPLVPDNDDDDSK